jgi:phytoene dehydrogenase-like protein
VIVIGGGFAGTSAASSLAKDGRKVLLLEANDYIGGRTHHINVPIFGG